MFLQLRSSGEVRASNASNISDGASTFAVQVKRKATEKNSPKNIISATSHKFKQWIELCVLSEPQTSEMGRPEGLVRSFWSTFAGGARVAAIKIVLQL